MSVAMNDAFMEVERYAHLLFGRIAIDQGWINYAQLHEALNIQHQSPEKKIGGILVELGYITGLQLSKTLLMQRRYAENPIKEWHCIPDVVLKGLVYSGYSFGQVKPKHLRQIRDNKRNLCDILSKDMKLATESDIEAFRNSISLSHGKCQQCSRQYTLFDVERENTIPCPVCWQVNLDIGAKEATRTTMPQQPLQTVRKSGQEINKIFSKNTAPYSQQNSSPQQTIQRSPEEILRAIMDDPQKIAKPSAENRRSLEKTIAKIPVELFHNAERDQTQTMETVDDPVEELEKVFAESDSGIEDASLQRTIARSAVEIEQPKQTVTMSNHARAELDNLYESLLEKAEQRESNKGEISRETLVRREEYIKIIRKTAYVSVGLICLVFVFVWVMWQPSPPLREKNAIVIEIPQSKPERPVQTTPSPKIIQEAEDQSLKKIEKLLFSSTTSLMVLQSAQTRLDQLLETSQQSPYLGDYFYLQARIIFAQVFIDQSEKFSIQQRKKVFRKISELLAEAVATYQREDSKTRFSWQVMPWMWDAEEHKVAPWDKEFPKLTFVEKSKVRKDIEKFKRYVALERKLSTKQ